MAYKKIKNISKRKKEKGVSLYYAVIIVSVILLISIGITLFLVGQINISEEITNSIAAISAADSGVEDTLYLHRVTCNKPDCAGNSLCDCGIGINITEFNNDSHSVVMGNGGSYIVRIVKPDDSDVDSCREGMDFCIQSKGTYHGTTRALEISAPAVLITVTLDASLANGGDWAYESIFGRSPPGSSDLIVSGPANVEVRSIIKWNLGGIGGIPPGVEITRATFKFYDKSVAGSGGDILLKYITDDGWSSAGTPFGGLFDWQLTAAEIETYPDFPNQQKEVDITEEVKDQYAGNGGDNVLSLKWVGTLNSDDLYSSPSDTANHPPFIEVVYYYP